LKGLQLTAATWQKWQHGRIGWNVAELLVAQNAGPRHTFLLGGSKQSDLSVEIRHLKYFVMVAEELHFSRAAARLNIATPTLSQQIRSLENMLGARLFKRKTKSAVELTHAGKRFLDEARAVLKQMTQAELIGRRAARGDTGVITLGYVFSASCSGLISTAMTQFRATHPEVSVQARLMETLPQFKAIIDGSVDVGILRVPRRYPSNLTGFLIERQPFRLALPDGHRLAKMKQIAPEALAGEPLIAAPLELELGFWGNIVAIAPARLSINIVERAPDVFTLLTLVGAGVGIAVVSGALSRIAIPGVVYRDIVGAPRQADHVAVYRKTETAPVVTAFLKSLRQNLAVKNTV
jgi:DNA-binding transcriptional LysR family regulator